jgi:hypothetical protein
MTSRFRSPWSAPPRLLRWLVALALSLGAAGPAVAEAECMPVDGGGALTVAGVGRVVFGELTTDRVRDAATFGGGVCLVVEGIEMTFRTQRLDVASFGDQPRLSAGDVRVSVPGWELEAATLRTANGSAELFDVVIVGSDGVGRATSIELDLTTGRVTAHDLRLLTATLRLDAVSATLLGSILEAESPQLSTCDCPPELAPVKLDARTAHVDLEAERVTLFGGAVVAGDVRWPLADPTSLDQATLASWRLPIALGPDPEGERGWLLRGLEREVATATRWSWLVASGGDVRPAAGAVRVDAGAPGASLALDAGSESLSLDLALVAPVVAGVTVSARQRFEGGRVDDPVRDTAVRTAWATTLTGDAVSVVGGIGGTLALTGQTLDGIDVAGPRLGVDGHVHVTRSADAALSPSLRLDAGASRYPWAARSQVWFGTAPRLEAAWGGARIDLRHRARWVSGSSPFGERVDRVTPLQRSDVHGTWSFDLDDGWRAAASLTARYDWTADPLRPGLAVGTERFTTGVRVWGDVGDGVLTAELDVAWAGLVDPRPERDASATARVAWTDGDVEVGVRSRFGWAEDTGWRDVTVFGAVPLQGEDAAWRWRPYLAVDLLAFAGGSGPWLRGHGLDLLWTSCCAVLDVGYRVDDGEATTRFAVSLPVRELDRTRLPSEGVR